MSSERRRRRATVWFADVLGYLDLSAEDEDAAFAVIDELQRLSSEAVGGAGGRIVKFVEDGALALFEAAGDAVDAALELQETFAASEVVAQHGSAVRIGIHVGEISEAPTGDVRGEGVRVASRIQAVGEPGSIVATESAAVEVKARGDLSLRRLGSFELEGVREAEVAYVVERAELEDTISPAAPPGISEAFVSQLADRYRIEEEIGRGGMATVYRAHDTRHDRPVALKVLHPELTDEGGAERFLREIRVTANLQHPHVLPLFDSGEASGRLFYVMPLVEGESLKDRLRRETQLGITDTLKIVRDVASALAHAHERGVIHRDIKPENILFSGGYALLADFGVARAVEQAAGDGLTKKGLAMGSPPYMAPEQMKESGTIDGRTDIYALGCVLYEMLVGAPPFTGPTAQVIMARQATDPVPPIRTVRMNVPEALEGVAMRCLEKVPADRFASAAELVAALDTVTRGHVASPAATPQEGATVPSAPAPTSGDQPSGYTEQPAGAPSGGYAAGTPPSGAYTPQGVPVAQPVDASFWGELKRRNVYRAGVIYLLAAGGITQGADAMLPTFGLEWAFNFLVLAAVLGFPLTLVVAWAFDLTKQGFRRTTPYGGTPTIEAALSATAARRRTTRLWTFGVVGIIAFGGLFPLHEDITVPNVDLSKDEAREIAEACLAERGWAGAYSEVVLFQAGATAAAFLQQTQGFDAAADLLNGPIPYWSWRFRWFRSEQTEEWRVIVHPGGRVGGFEHRIARTEEAASLDDAEARATAEAFLRELGWDPTTLVDDGVSSTSLENRVDRTFQWRVSEFTYTWPVPGGETEEGFTRLTVRVQGDVVGFYSNAFVVPESFQRARARQSNQASAVQLFLLPFVFLLIAIVVVVKEVRRDIRFVPWGRAALLALVLGLLGGLTLTMMQWTSSTYNFQTSTTWSSHLAFMGFGALLFGFLIFGGFFILAALADPLARRHYPSAVGAWDRLLSREWRAPEVSRAALVGLPLAGILLGISSLESYTIVSFPGAWGVAASNAVIMQDAPLLVLTQLLMIGLAAAFLTLLYLGALALLRRFLKSTAVAVVTLAVLGVFTNPGLLLVQPIYIPGAFAAVELLFIGAALAGWGPVTVLYALFVRGCVWAGAEYIALGNGAAFSVGVVLLALALLPLLPALVAKVSGEEAATGDGAAVAT